MLECPLIVEYNDRNLSDILEGYPSIRLISTENRTDFYGDFPTHNRYFSNGDWPLIALIKYKGTAVMGCNNKRLELPDNHLVFFDDSMPHSWVFKKSNLTIFYYRHTDVKSIAPTSGDYCLDNYF